MKAITIRNLPPEVDRVIRKNAKEKGISLNKTVLHLLEASAGMPVRKEVRSAHRDLDALAGSWTREEARHFDKALLKQRAIDPDLWP